MRKQRTPYLSFLNFVLFCVFMGCLWSFSFDLGVWGGARFGGTEVQILMLQVVSLLLLIGAVQMSHKGNRWWRLTLLTLSFLALSESSLVALLSPVG